MPRPLEFPSIVHMLRDAAKQAPEREALVLGERRLTYAHYDRVVTAFAQQLAAAGVRGERVGVLAGNGISICVATFAVLAAGAQMVPLNPGYTRRELQQILDDACPVALICDSDNQHCVQSLRTTHHIELISVLDDAQWFSTESQTQNDLVLPLPDPGDLAMLQYTGGTTGVPKGVNLSHGATVKNVAQRETLLPTSRHGERIVCVMPLFHAYALAMGLYLAPYCLGTLVIRPKYHPEDLLATFERERISVFPGSPTLFKSLLAHGRFADTDFSNLSVCFSGSAPLAEDTLMRWESAVGAPIYEGYGQTEAGPILTFNPRLGVRKAGSVGIPVSETEIEIVDVATGATIENPGEIGEIRARGPQLMLGYRGLAAETARALRDGWLYTGDLGEFDEDGYLFIRDRLKDMVIVSGYNVYPREIEEVLFMHTLVADVAAVGVPDNYRGEIIKAYVVVTRCEPNVHEQLVEHCTMNLAKYKVPAAIEIVSTLPKTTVGKTDKALLRRWADESAAAS